MSCLLNCLWHNAPGAVIIIVNCFFLLQLFFECDIASDFFRLRSIFQFNCILKLFSSFAKNANSLLERENSDMCDSLNKSSLRRQDFLFALISLVCFLFLRDKQHTILNMKICLCNYKMWVMRLTSFSPALTPTQSVVSVVTLGDDRWLLLQAALNLFVVRAALTIRLIAMTLGLGYRVVH